jgi:class III cytochrome C family protein/cytochrome c7-like protein
MPGKDTFRRLNHRELTLGGAGFLGALVLSLLWQAGARPEQPIRFNHQKHVGAGLQCSDCHTLFASSPWAGLPKIDICMTCHSDPVTQSSEEAKIRDLAKQEKPLVWKQINQLPSHLYFSHKTHASSREIACATCHGAMDKATAPPTRPLFEWKMDTCLACHQRNHASVDCDTCHR